MNTPEFSDAPKPKKAAAKKTAAKKAPVKKAAKKTAKKTAKKVAKRQPRKKVTPTVPIITEASPVVHTEPTPIDLPTPLVEQVAVITSLSSLRPDGIDGGNDPLGRHRIGNEPDRLIAMLAHWIDPNEPALPPELIAVLAYRARAVGFQWGDIARTLGFVSEDALRVFVERERAAAFDQASTSLKAELMSLDLMRLDLLTSRFMPSALDGDINAATVVLRVIGQRSKMAGYEDGSKVATTINQKNVILSADPERMLQQLTAIADGVDPQIVIEPSWSPA
jgi:hypothetical protein